jgi:hypothetical protein
MSIFGNIASAIFGTSKGAPTPSRFGGSIVIRGVIDNERTERRIGGDGKADVAR